MGPSSGMLKMLGSRTSFVSGGGVAESKFGFPVVAVEASVCVAGVVVAASAPMASLGS